MKKILLIIQREYLTRVVKKSFIVTTLLVPILYVGMIFGTAYLGEKSSTVYKIALLDSSGKFTQGRIDIANNNDKSSILSLVNEIPDSLINNFERKGFDGYAIVPAGINAQNMRDSIVIKSNRTLGAGANLSMKLNNVWNEIKYEDLGIDSLKRNILNSSRLNVQLENMKNKESNATIALIIGYIAGILLYMILIIYGMQVMMGVVEEKTNRIAEIMVSSVKPFQLMIGKIIGIALVALTQFLLWIVFVFVLYNVTKSGSFGDNSSVSQFVGQIQNVFTSVNLPLVLSMFVFYFLGGFLFYSSIYAAVGSAINEDTRDAQSLSMPVTMIIILSFLIMTVVMRDPIGPIAVWGSIIPLTSPIVMMARIPYGVPGTVPYWQLGLSIILLIAAFLFTTWFAGKIYRTGILMYGKKPTWKEMLKWAFRK